MNFILASASQRRIELLKKLIPDFDVVASNFDESKVDFDGDCAKYVMKLAEEKAKSILKIKNNGSIILGCDTIVSYNSNIFGKPKDEEEAFCFLRKLSGNIHKVYTGLALINTMTGEDKTDYVCTEVKFSQITDKEILQYIKTGEPMDKAGAYAIQGYAAVFIERINGCFYNVVGLPLNKLNSMLSEMGVNL